MEEGFILDYAHSGATVSKWTEGAPKPSTWSGLKVNEPLQVATYRCTGCGYLESYARKEKSWEDEYRRSHEHA